MELEVGGRGKIISDFGLRISDCEFKSKVSGARRQNSGEKSIGQRVGGWRSASLEVGGKDKGWNGGICLAFHGVNIPPRYGHSSLQGRRRA